MNGPEVLRVVDAIHRDKNIDKEIVFEGIAQAILSASRKHFGEDFELSVAIDRETGEPTVLCDGEELEKEVLGDILGRIAAQTAKQVMIQKIREAERDALFIEFTEMKSQQVTGSISRFDGGAATVNLGKVEAFLPRSEQIPGESLRVGDRVRAVVIDVRKAGSRVKVILSRAHPDLVLRLFEIEIPEVSDRVIEIRSLAREAGYRSKVAVSCIDSKIDAVGACVGMRGARIRNIVDELAGERIDIVRWNDSLQVLVPNALQPAEVEDVILCPMLGRVIVLVRDDQLSLAIGKRGQNVRLASKLVGWDIEIMTRDELDEQLDRTVAAFSLIDDVSEELAEGLVAQGFFSYYDLSVIEPDQLAELGGLTDEQCDQIVEYADVAAVKQEEEESRRRAEEKAARALSAKQAAEQPATVAAKQPATVDAESPATVDAESPEGEESGGESGDSAEGNGESVAQDEPAPGSEAEVEDASNASGVSGDEAPEGAVDAEIPAEDEVSEAVGEGTSGAEETGVVEAEPTKDIDV